MQLTYENINGIFFDIDIQNARVPMEANYWGYNIKTTERRTNLVHVYFAGIKKEVCGTQNEADLFIMGSPIEYFKTTLLDRYENGSHLWIWPDFSNGWIVI